MCSVTYLPHYCPQKCTVSNNFEFILNGILKFIRLLLIYVAIK